MRRPVPLAVLAAGAGTVGAACLGGISAPDRARAGEPAPIPTPIGVGRRYHPGPRGPLRPVRLPCSSGRAASHRVHLELFANRRVVLVPAGIGKTRKPDGRCPSPLRTRDPTGVIEVDAGSTYTLGQFFALWGEPLSRSRLLGFRARPGERLLAFVDGRRRRGDPRSIPLRRHSEIVLELGGYVRPHTSYRFPRRRS